MADSEVTSPRTVLSSDSLLGEQAFCVFRNNVTKHAVENNEKLREENKTLQPIRSRLLKYDIINSSSGAVVLGEQSLLNYVSEDSDHLYYDLEHWDSMPIQEVKTVFPRISGVDRIINPIALRFKATILQDETTQLVVTLAGSIQVIGKVENLSGSIDDLRNFIDSNRITLYFSRLGGVDVTTGQPIPWTMDTCFERATFRPDVLVMPKSLAQPILHSAKTNTTSATDDLLRDMKQLCCVKNTGSESLCQAAKDRAALLLENAMLISSKDMFDSVEIISPENSCRLALSSGEVRTYGDKEWVINVPPENGTFPLLSLRDLTIRFSNATVTGAGNYVGHVQISPQMVYFKINGCVSAVLVFHPSWNEVDFDEILAGSSFDAWFQSHFMPAGWSIAGAEWGEGRPPDYGLCMRLVALHFKLPYVQENLDVLGVSMD